jgi:hypothetical protein
MKNKTCMICKLPIIVDEEQYVEVKHYEKKGKLLSNGFYHIKCFRDRINGSDSQKALVMKTMQLLNRVEGMVQ